MVLITGNAYDKDNLSPIKTQCYTATVDNLTLGYTTGDKIIKVNNYDDTTGAISVSNPSFWLNVNTDVALTSAPSATEISTEMTPCSAPSGDAEIAKKFDTNLTTGEIAEVYQVVLFDMNGSVVGTPYYVDMAGATYTPVWTVADEPVRVVIGDEVLSVGDTAVALTRPAFTRGAHLQVHVGNDIKFTVMAGSTPVQWLTGVWFHVEQWQEVILNSQAEVIEFLAIALDSSAAAELYIQYFNTSIETGI